VERAQAAEADARVEVVEHRAERLGGADVVARGEQVAGVQADPRALVAAGAVDSLRELVEGAPERPAGPRGVLEVQRAVLGLRERLGDRRRRGERVVDRAAVLQRRPGCRTTAWAPERRAAAARRSATRATSRGSPVLGRAVEQVDGVDEQRVDVGAAIAARKSATSSPSTRAASTPAGSG
jgi:hypothetical protein